MIQQSSIEETDSDSVLPHLDRGLRRTPQTYLVWMDYEAPFGSIHVQSILILLNPQCVGRTGTDVNTI